VWGYVREQVDVQNEIRRTMETVQSSIREMLPSQNGSFAIEEAGQTEFIYFANVDEDEEIERVRLFLSGDELQRGITDPVGNPATYPAANEVVSTVARYIHQSGDIFAYYDETYTGSEAALPFPVNPTDVHLIRISFLVDKDINQLPPASEMVFEVTPRNLKTYSSP